MNMFIFKVKPNRFQPTETRFPLRQTRKRDDNRR